jgi:pimeloyl-ACP methyl ester carboxylesterase
MESAADDVHALLRQLGALTCVLCGLSMGGYVALAFAKKCPSDLRGLVLIDTRAEGDSAEAKTNRQKGIDTVRQGGSKAIADQMLPKLLAESTTREKPQVAQSVRQMIEACPPRTIEHALIALRDRTDQTSELPSIGVPTLIVVGEKDAITPPDLARAMNQSIPRSRLAVIPDAGHMSPMEQPEAVNGQLDRFLASLK